FPGTQGGPLEHVIAGKAQAFYEDLQPAFKDYIGQVVKNAAAMAEVFNESETIRVVTGGTANHLLVLDLTKTGLTGKDAQALLDSVMITTNKEAIPNDQRSPFVTSGLRVGTPAITSRGFKEDDAKQVASLIIKALDNADDQTILAEVKEAVHALTQAHPVD
ncbi:MAG: serine hydroxymethyltransferase, partial [Limosilactobacillus fermentum]|nr:serine hydroxymethyltransferase [Limosilactobacillus fermentum]